MAIEAETLFHRESLLANQKCKYFLRGEFCVHIYRREFLRFGKEER
jgi:hypothetical protein